MHVHSFCGAQRLYSGVIMLPVTREKWPACNFFFLFFYKKPQTTYFCLDVVLRTTHLFSKYLEMNGFERNAQLDHFDLTRFGLIFGFRVMTQCVCEMHFTFFLYQQWK